MQNKTCTVLTEGTWFTATDFDDTIDAEVFKAICPRFLRLPVAGDYIALSDHTHAIVSSVVHAEVPQVFIRLHIKRSKADNES